MNDKPISLNDLEDSVDHVYDPTLTLDDDGEESISGDATIPEADDDTLANEHQVGIQIDSNEESPEELDIARDVDTAERLHRDE